MVDTLSIHGKAAVVTRAGVVQGHSAVEMVQP